MERSQLLNTYRGYRGTHTLITTEAGIMVTCDDPCAYHLGYRGTFATIEEATAYIDKDIASEPEALRLVLQWCEEGNTKALQDCLIRVSDIRRMGFTPPAGYRYGW